jgi:NTP pyrophosphatase (non-canonical NTP hydrolase)
MEGKLNWHGKDLGADFDETINFLKSKIKREHI